ncbi:MAG: DUF2920 family protein [Bacteroidales bacterium]|nr:DUF2920 family protein [Bacteroidales bacterium]
MKIIPHKDIELNVERESLVSFLFLPEQLDENTGVFFYVNDLNDKAESDYNKAVLFPAIAEKTNCIVVSVNYFGYLRGERIEFSEAFINNLNRIYALSFSSSVFKALNNDKEAVVLIANNIVKKGISSLDVRCQPILKTGKNEYQSWGFLPAIDIITVLGKIIKEYSINKSRIFAYGKNYGGYIAHLMGKYAPNTFTAIIERDAFCKTKLNHIVGGEVMEPDSEIRLNISGYGQDFTIACASNNPWTIEDEDSKFYFSDSHRKIRNLLAENHRLPSKTKYFMYHSEDNLQTTLAEKEKLVSLLKETNEVVFKKASERNLFMKISDLDFLEKVIDEYNLKNLVSTAETDFDKNSSLTFECGEVNYVFDYSDENRVIVERK